MSNIKRMKDKDGNYIYPVTHASAVFDDEGNNLINLLEEANSSGLSGVNVDYFGAVGDGKTDDTQAIQTAIEYAITNEIYEVCFGAGTYACNLNVPSRITLRGLTPAGVTGDAVYTTKLIPYDGNFPVISIKGDTPPEYITISSLLIKGIAATGSKYYGVAGIYIEGAQHIAINKVAICYFDKNVHITNNDNQFTYFIYINDSEIKQGIENNLYVSGQSTTSWMSAIYINNTYIANTTGNNNKSGSNIYTTTNLFMTNVWVDGDGVHNTVIDGSSGVYVFIHGHNVVFDSASKSAPILCIYKATHMKKVSCFLNGGIAIDGYVDFQHADETAVETFSGDMTHNTLFYPIATNPTVSDYLKFMDRDSVYSDTAHITYAGGKLILGLPETGYGYLFSDVSYGKPVAFSNGRLWFSNADKVFRYKTSFPNSDKDGVTLVTYSNNVPATKDAEGAIGTIASDETYIYICTDTNTWTRIKKDETW